MLVFTTAEAWSYIPGTPVKSVHCSDWSPSAFALSETECSRWKNYFFLRDFSVLPNLELARRAKAIGKGLDAVVWVEGPDAPRSQLEAEELRELCNVSAVELYAFVTTPLEENETQTCVKIASELGRQKCERCWHWEPVIGGDPAYPGICLRCVEAVRSLVS
jgi:isoleucyl-tRNA synthetase